MVFGAGLEGFNAWVRAIGCMVLEFRVHGCGFGVRVVASIWVWKILGRTCILEASDAKLA